MAVTLSNLNRFLTGRFSTKFAISKGSHYTLRILPHYLVKILDTRNCCLREISETISHEKLKLSCKIFKLYKQNWLQFLFVVKGIALKQQISKFYQFIRTL